MMWSWICLGCWVCWGAPAWPEKGEPDAAWVLKALEWRTRVGLDDCLEKTLAIDALTLKWVSESSDVVVRIQSSNWPELSVAPELARPLAQIQALQHMRGRDIGEDQMRRRLRRMARRSSALWRPDLAQAFEVHKSEIRSAAHESEDKTARGTGEHQQGEGG